MSEETNQVEAIWNGRTYTPRYVEVMEYAQDLACNRGDGPPALEDLVTMYDVFTAVCNVHPNAFSELLGEKCAVVRYDDFIFGYYGDANERPEDGEDESIREKHPVRYSSEVDRYLSLYGGIMAKMLDTFPSGGLRIDSLHIAGVLLWDASPAVRNMLQINGINYSQEQLRAVVAKALREISCREEKERIALKMDDHFSKISEIREYLLSRCFGQDAAIEEIVLQLSMFWTLPKEERGLKPLSLFLTGPSGCGKSHLIATLQDAYELIMGVPKNDPINFSRFSTEQTPIDLIGRDTCWKDGGQKGHLTLMAETNPRGIIVIDNYELGHPFAVSYVNTAIEKGCLKDGYTQANVFFSDNIFIISTNASKFTDSEDFNNLIKAADSMPPRDKVVEGVTRHYPSFGATMRLVDSNLLLNRHTALSFVQIIRSEISKVASRIESIYGLACDFSDERNARLFIDSHASVGSAHPIASVVEDVLLKPVQRLAISDFKRFSKCRKVTLTIADLPDIDNVPPCEGFPSFDDWVTVQTEKRLLQAKRLKYTCSVEISGDTVNIRITDLEYIVLPSIEDTKYFSVVVPDVSFDDLIGVDLVRNRVSEIIDYFNGRIKSSVRPETGIVLYGPPGTGKTSVAKAIARELGVPFIMVMGSDFSKGVVGAGVEAVKELFAVARRYRAVVFIDEIDGIGNRDRESAEGARIINALLTELDGFTERNMLVIGATNRYETLDEALVRPGRLSVKIQLGLLHNPEDREKLIRLCINAAHVALSQELIDSLVKITAAWSPANMVAMVNGAIRISQRENEKLEMRHFIQSRTAVLLGEDPQNVESSESSTWLVAVHEAGHAVAAVLHSIPFVQASISGNGDLKGFVERIVDNEIYTSRKLQQYIDMSLAGRAAERLLAEPTDGVGSDFARATRLAVRMVRLGLGGGNIITIEDETTKEFVRDNRDAVERLLRDRMEAIENILMKNRTALENVAKALMVQKVLFEADIRAVVEKGGGDNV